MASQLAEFSGEIATLVNQVSPAVVVVHGRPRTPSSGAQWRKGLIVTVEHALRRDEDITVTDSNGQTLQANRLGRDPGTYLTPVDPLESITERPTPAESGGSGSRRPPA